MSEPMTNNKFTPWPMTEPAYTEQDLREARSCHCHVCDCDIETGGCCSQEKPCVNCRTIAEGFYRIRSEARAGMREACESLNRDLVSMVAYRHALREVTENLLKYVEDVYPRCPESSRRELEEADRRKQLIAEANAILHETALTPAYEAIERIKVEAERKGRLAEFDWNAKEIAPLCVPEANCVECDLRRKHRAALSGKET